MQKQNRRRVLRPSLPVEDVELADGDGSMANLWRLLLDGDLGGLDGGRSRRAGFRAARGGREQQREPRSDGYS